MPSHEPTGQPYRPDIDGLRAVAVLSVVLFHARLPGVTGGFVGVDVFFVISGYLITGIIAREIGRGDFSLIRFYERRARRILPALFAVLVVSFVAAWFIALPEAFADFARSAAATLLFVSNIHFWQSISYFAAAAEFHPLLHTWSLAVEEQFYIGFPLLLMLLARVPAAWRKPLVLVFAAACLLVGLAGAHFLPKASFYLLPARAWELLCGAVLALGLVPPLAGRLQREAAAAIGLALILAAVFGYDAGTPFPGAAALLPCVGATLLIHAGSAGSTLVGRWLSAGPVVFVGLISYSLYLWHWPALAFLRLAYGSPHLPAAVAATAVAIAFVGATLSWRFVERPFRRPAVIGRRAVFTFSGAGMAALLAVSIAVVAAGGLRWRIDEHTLAVAAGAKDVEANRVPCTNRSPAAGLCHIGDPAARPNVLFWGDSHAGALMSAVDAALIAAGRGGWLATNEACPPLLGVRRGDRTDSLECVRRNEALVGLVEAAKGGIDTVVLAGRWAIVATGERMDGEGQGGAPLEAVGAGAPAGLDNAALFHRGLDATVARLRAAGVRVVLLGGVAEIGWDVPLTLASRPRLGLPLPEAPTLAEVEQRNLVADAVLHQVAEARGAELVPLAPLLCAPICKVIDGDHTLYVDDDHLSAYGARRFVGPALAGHLWPPATVKAGKKTTTSP